MELMQSPSSHFMIWPKYERLHATEVSAYSWGMYMDIIKENTIAVASIAISEDRCRWAKPRKARSTRTLSIVVHSLTSSPLHLQDLSSPSPLLSSSDVSTG